MSSSREELALETQLLLQEVTQATQEHAPLEIDVDGAPVESELEVAKHALVAKLMAKKEQNRKQRLAVNQKRYGLSVATAAAAGVKLNPSVAAKPVAPKQMTPTKLQQQQRLKMPMAAGAPSRKKKELLSKLRNQAIQQGSQEMAKLFGYASYEDQVKHLNKVEKMKILQHEMIEQNAAAKKEQEAAAGPHGQGDQEEEEDEPVVVVEHGEDDQNDVEMVEHGAAEDEPMESTPVVGRVATTPKKTATVASSASTPSQRSPAVDGSLATSRRRRNQIEIDDEDDGNEADSEQDNAKDDHDDADMDDADAAEAKAQRNKDKAAGFRRLLEAEAQQNRQRKRLNKSGGGDFMELEAEEDEEEDALKIAGLGDFGFGVPQAKTQESKEAEEEKRALNLREDDLEGIVDELSDDERAQERDLDEIFRKEQEDQDQERVKEVMRNVKEGFGRNRRAFSAGLGLGSEARGRFNLNELVAADGSKLEAARLGLLESDEELSDGDTKSKKKKKKHGEGEEGEEDEEDEEEDEDEEAEMERMLRERYQNQPKIYMTSSESENEDEQEITAANAEGAGDDAASDEERERQQMKLFSERARVNRRMARMKDLQRQESQDTEAAAPTQTVMPNLLLEEDEDSQEVRCELPLLLVDAMIEI